VATYPPQVYNGEGSTCEAAEDEAAETALIKLFMVCGAQLSFHGFWPTVRSGLC